MKHDGLNFRKTSAYKKDTIDEKGYVQFKKAKTGEKVEVEHSKTNMASINETGQYLLLLDDIVYIAPRPKIKIDENMMNYFNLKEKRKLEKQIGAYVKEVNLDVKTQKFQLLIQNPMNPKKGILKSYTVNSYAETEKLYEQNVELTKEDLKEFKENNKLFV